MTTPSLSDFQRDLMAALRAADRASAASWASQPGFAVYRNTGLLACIDALEANYPVVTQLVGRDWLRAAAHDYVRTQPPTDVRLLLYGDGFAAYVADAARAHDLPYLADVARLDRAWTEAHAAADAVAASAADLAALPAESLPTLRLVPHPAARWLWCAKAPAYSIWSHHRDARHDEAGELDLTQRWRAEGALITRPMGAVQWCALSQAGCALLQACADGHTLLEALEATASVVADGDVGAELSVVLRAGALTAWTNPESRP